MSKYDFTNIENQIDMTESQLEDEINRYRGQSNKTSTLLTIFWNIVFVYSSDISIFYKQFFYLQMVYLDCFNIICVMWYYINYIIRCVFMAK